MNLFIHGCKGCVDGGLVYVKKSEEQERRGGLVGCKEVDKISV